MVLVVSQSVSQPGNIKKCVGKEVSKEGRKYVDQLGNKYAGKYVSK